MSIDDFVAAACTEGRSQAWTIAEAYCKAAGIPPHEAHVRSAVHGLRHWATDDPAFVFLRLATVGEVVERFLSRHPPVAGRLLSLDGLVKTIIAWCPSIAPRWEVRRELSQRLKSVVLVND